LGVGRGTVSYPKNTKVGFVIASRPRRSHAKYMVVAATPNDKSDTTRLNTAIAVVSVIWGVPVKASVVEPSEFPRLSCAPARW
jgi:hypothetical protein